VREGIEPHAAEIVAILKSGGFAILAHEPSDMLAGQMRERFLNWDFVRYPVIGLHQQQVLSALGADDDTTANWVNRERGEFDYPILVFSADAYILLNWTNDGYQFEPDLADVDLN